MKDKAFNGYIKLAFLVSIFYWIYLSLTSKMIISFDAADYESLGKMLSQQGWQEFFKSGPHREPFYPALIAFSMTLGKIIGISYQIIQVIIQLLFLLATQILILRILRLLKINNLLSALIILYLGVSPAIVNSAFSLYSEIVAYPFILAIMLLIYISWVSFLGSRKKVILLAIMTSALFVIMILNKGIFELVTPIFLLLLVVSALSTRNRKLIINVLTYLAVFIVIFYSSVISYKSVNKISNGIYTVTNRGANDLYGETSLRMEPLTSERFFIALSSVPGEGVCKFIFAERGDHYSPARNSATIGQHKVSELNQGNMSPQAIYDTLILLSKQKVLQNPAQYVLFTVIEGLKMFFWESTQIGYVRYPAGLTKFFAWPVFKNGLRLGMSFLTLFTAVYLAVLLWRERRNVLTAGTPFLFIYLCLLFIFSFISSYSIFWIITRYALPIASLYLIIIAFVFQRLCSCATKRSGI